MHSQVLLPLHRIRQITLQRTPKLQRPALFPMMHLSIFIPVSLATLPTIEQFIIQVIHAVPSQSHPFKQTTTRGTVFICHAARAKSSLAAVVVAHGGGVDYVFAEVAGEGGG
jgi:hypothetical protein